MQNIPSMHLLSFGRIVRQQLLLVFYRRELEIVTEREKFPKWHVLTER